MAELASKIFLFLTLFTIIQRLLELILSHKNQKKIISMGGIVIKEKNYFFMVLLHISWLLSALIIIILNRFEYNFYYFLIGVTFFVLGQLLRLTAIFTLKERWTTKIVILPGKNVVKKGIFNYIRHPNYLGVVFEIFSLPLMAGSLYLSLIFSILNFIILFFRIKKEEKCLSQHNNYREAFL